MNYLVDANVLSEATKPSPDGRVISWLKSHEKELVTNPIIVGEIRFGILLLPPSTRRTRLEIWFKEGVAKLGCLDWTSETGLKWAELLASLRATGKAMSVKDSLIAATALQHNMRIVTRNESDFAFSGAHVINPFST